ncbi:Titin [Chelonia mydas]|uniref:Titin n=1 Tax=Chelonia mydas TaxID=8469 RepID=M7CMP5_CHEMY|nr:Titin [Chelonia mydas]
MGTTNDPIDGSDPLAFPGVVPAPTLYMSQRSAQEGDSVLLQCSVISQAPAKRVIFCKDGEEVFSQTGLEKKVTYSYAHAVSMGSSGNYSCGYEIKESDKRVNRSQLSPAKHLSVTGDLRAPTLYVSQTSARQGDSLRLKCSVVSQAPVTRVVFCKDGEEVFSQMGLEKKVTYSYDHAVSMGSSGNYSCDLRAPTLYVSQTSARQGDSLRLKCSVVSQAPVTRVVFCKDGEEVFSQMGLEKKVTYSYDHAVSMGSSGNYSCGYEIKESDKWVNRSQLSPSKYLSVTEPVMSLAIWATRCVLVLFLLVSAPIITFMLEKRSLPDPTGLEETHEGSNSIMGGSKVAGCPVFNQKTSTPSWRRHFGGGSFTRSESSAAGLKNVPPKCHRRPGTNTAVTLKPVIMQGTAFSRMEWKSINCMKKLVQIQTDIIFLSKCKQMDIVPKGLKVTPLTPVLSKCSYSEYHLHKRCWCRAGLVPCGEE